MTTLRLTSTLVALALTGLLAACSGGGGDTTSPAPPTAAPPPVTTAPAPPTTTPAHAQSPATDAPAGASVPRCTTGELSVSLGQGDAAAGSVYRDLVFTNTSSHTCELRGFPGVSYVAGDDGHQIGPAAVMEGDRGGQIEIARGRTAIAPLRLVNVQNFDEAGCRPTPVRGLRVYPPGDTASLFVPMEGTGCSIDPPGPQLSVRTMQAS
jgi:hypothetical protein